MTLKILQARNFTIEQDAYNFVIEFWQLQQPPPKEQITANMYRKQNSMIMLTIYQLINLAFRLHTGNQSQSN